MDRKTETIVKAGWEMFSRYGFSKTTMSDIAGEAGVARQTVYNAFASKEEILRAVVIFSTEESLAAAQAAWASDLTLEEKLSAFQQVGPQTWYEAMLVAPDWDVLMDGLNKSASDVLQEIEDKWIDALEAMLREHGATVANKAFSLREIAAFFYTACKNAKYGARDRDDFASRMKVTLAACLALLES